MGNVPGINRSLTLVRFTRYGPRHVVGSLIIPSPFFCVISHFFVLRDFYPVPISSPLCSPVHSRGAPLESVVSLPPSSRSVKLAEDLPMILVVYIFQPGSYPTFLYISLVSQDGVRTINVIFTALSWELIRSVPRVRPTCSATNPSQLPIGVGGSTSLPPPSTTFVLTKCLKQKKGKGRQRLPVHWPVFVLFPTGSNSRCF